MREVEREFFGAFGGSMGGLGGGPASHFFMEREDPFSRHPAFSERDFPPPHQQYYQ